MIYISGNLHTDRLTDNFSHVFPIYGNGIKQDLLQMSIAVEMYVHDYVEHLLYTDFL